MIKRIYNLIYAIYFLHFGLDEEYEDANSDKYEQYAIEMLERIQEFQSTKGSKPEANEKYIMDKVMTLFIFLNILKPSSRDTNNAKAFIRSLIEEIQS